MRENDILVIPDSHCRPEITNERFSWLGRLVIERRPQYIVHIGDLFDMKSLCSYDEGTFGYESRRYSLDIEAGHNALEKFNSEVDGFFIRRKIRRDYSPQKFFIIGNHEYRINRWIERNPKLIGHIGLKDLKLAEYGWNPVPFLVPIQINGVYFSHYIQRPNSDGALSGENLAANLIKKNFTSTVVGHSHSYDYAERNDLTGQRMFGLVAGCFLEPGQTEDYARQSNLRWRNCVSYLHHSDTGYDLETISVERLRSLHG